MDRVVDAINAAATRVPEEVEERTFCGGQGAPTQVLWFSYAETDLAITYNDGTCADLDLGDATVGGGDTVAVVLSDLLWEQRESLPPPTVRLRARCSPNLTEDTPLVLTDRLDLVDAVVCEYPYGVRQARLTPAALRAINTDFATSEGFTEQAGCPPRMFRGVTAWGDRFSWWGSCWNFAIQNTYGTALHWQASPTEQTILEDLRFGPPRKQVTTHPGR